MADQVNKAYVPEYFTRFACIGSNCEDTCCAGWRVDIDRKTYKKYQNVPNKAVQSILDESIKRNRGDVTDVNYARIQLKPDASCPLLTEEKLCMVQKEMGESYLSNTCSEYPRKNNVVFGMLERSLTMSCPEAARLALLNTNKMQQIEIPMSNGVKFQVNRRIQGQKSDEIEYYFPNLRVFTLELLQNRAYSISNRLIVLGLAMNRVQECVDSNDLGKIPSLLAAYTSALNNGDLTQSLEGIPSNLTIQVKLMKAIADRRLLQGIASYRYNQCYAEFLYGLGITQNAEDEDIVTNYLAAYQNYYLPFMSQREYIFENYLVNNSIMDTFPLTNTLSVYESYVYLAMSYAWMKLVLIGMAGMSKEAFNEDAVVKLIQSFSKVVEHNFKFKKDVIKLLQEDGYDAMPYMSILLRN